MKPSSFSASEPLATKTLALSFTNSDTTSHHLQACHSLLCYCCCNRFIKYRHKVKEDCTLGRCTSGFCRSSHGVTRPPRVQERDVVSEVVEKLSWEHSPKAGKKKKQESLEEMSSSKSPHSTTPPSKLEVRHRQVKAEAAPFTGHLHAWLQPTQHSCGTAFPITAALMLPNLPISLFSLFHTQPVLFYCTARNSTTELACTWHWFGNLHLQPPHHTLLRTSAAALKQIRG